jgi:hypothetical protein
MKKEPSVSVATAAGSAGAKKLGQPVHDSNFVSERKSSVPLWRRTRYCSGVRPGAPLSVSFGGEGWASHRSCPAEYRPTIARLRCSDDSD